MKKNLFLLFSIYFFVVQAFLIGVLRGQTNFFLLGAINLVAILLIGVLYNTTEKTTDKEKSSEKTHIHENKVAFKDHFRSSIKERKKKKELIMPIIVSLIVAAGIFLLFKIDGVSFAPLFVFALAL